MGSSVASLQKCPWLWGEAGGSWSHPRGCAQTYPGWLLVVQEPHPNLELQL